jgi:hypothetical protein
MRKVFNRLFKPRLRDDDSDTVAATVLPRCHQHTPAGNKTTARGRSPGFRIIAGVLLPKTFKASVGQWTFALRLQLRGQPRF